MSFVISVADLNSQSIEATLDGLLYYIILDWNESGQYWIMKVRNSAYETVAQGIAVSANFPLTKQFRYSDMPPGELIAQSYYQRNGPIPRDGFVSGRYELVYYTQQNLLDMGLLPMIGFTASAV